MRPCLLLLSGLVGFVITSQAQYTMAEQSDHNRLLHIRECTGVTCAETKYHAIDRRAVTTSSIDQTTLLTRAKILPPQQTLHLGPATKMLEGVHKWTSTINFSPRSSPPPGVYTVEAPHEELHRRSMEDAPIVDSVSPVVHAEEDTINQDMTGGSSMHEVENTGNPRIPLVMPRPLPAVDRRDEPTADKLSHGNSKMTGHYVPIYNNVSILPSLVVPVHERFPDREYADPHHNEHGKHFKEYKNGKRYGIEVAYDLPLNNASYCALEFLYPEVLGSINGSTAYIIHGYKYGAGSVSKSDTWNTRPQVDRSLTLGTIVANTSGIFINGGRFFCNKKSGQAAFFIEAIDGDASAEIKITAQQPNSLVVRMYGNGDWLKNYGNADHVIFPPGAPNHVAPRNEIPKTLNGTEEVEESYAVIFNMLAYGSGTYDDGDD